MFLNNLVTKDGLHLIYHRKGSVGSGKIKPIDVYEIMTTDNVYATFYFNVYADENILTPPEGYLFESDFDFDEEIEDVFIYEDNLKSIEDIAEYSKNLPLLEKHLSESKGVNGKMKNFPFDLLKNFYEEGVLDFVKDIDALIASIKPRD